MYIPSDWSKIFDEPLSRNFSILFVFIIGFFIFYGMPGSFFLDYGFIDVFSNFFIKIIPSIEKWTRYSSHPKQTSLFFSICWILLPLQVIAIYRNDSSRNNFVEKWKKEKNKFLQPIILIIFLFSALFLSTEFAVKDSPSCFICINTSGAYQVIFGSLTNIANAGLIAGLLWWLLNIKKIYKN